jgi:ABC-type branched-subunit amino acid transport system substrate-binding protein
VNSKGGVYGRKIRDIVLDDAYTAPQALANATQLAAKPIFAFFAGCGSVAPPQIQTVAQPKKIPYLFPVASIAPASNVYAMLPAYAQQVAAEVKWTMAKYGKGSLYMINTQIPNSAATLAAAMSAVRSSGGTWAGESDETPGQVDLTTPILAMKATQPDYVLLMLTASDAARALTIMQEQGAMPKKKVLATSTTPNLAFMNSAPNHGAGVIMISPVAPFDRPSASLCLKVFATSNPTVTPDGTSIEGCVQAQALVAALQGAGKNLTRSGIENVLNHWNNKNISSALPPLSYRTLAQHGSGESSMFILAVDGKVLSNLATVTVK